MNKKMMIFVAVVTAIAGLGTIPAVAKETKTPAPKEQKKAQNAKARLQRAAEQAAMEAAKAAKAANATAEEIATAIKNAVQKAVAKEVIALASEGTYVNAEINVQVNGTIATAVIAGNDLTVDASYKNDAGEEVSVGTTTEELAEAIENSNGDEFVPELPTDDDLLDQPDETTPKN